MVITWDLICEYKKEAPFVERYETTSASLLNLISGGRTGGPSTTFDLAARCSLGSFVRVLIGGR